MKIIMGNYEVEIKAKFITEDRYSKDRTQALLNKLSMVFEDASQFERGQGCPAFSREYHIMSDDIYEQLKEQGCYD